MDVLAYHRHLATQGALGPLGLFGACPPGVVSGLSGASAPAPAQRSHLDPAMRRDLKRDGFTDAQIEGMFGG